jgi:predicted PP-loop superfamily ATPase
MEAVSLLLVIKDVLTNSGSNRVKEEQHAMRMRMIYDKFILSQSIDINGDVVAGAGGEDYLGGATETYDRRRIDVANAVFNIIMADHIEKKLPTNLLSSRGGYALGILRLRPQLYGYDTNLQQVYG